MSLVKKILIKIEVYLQLKFKIFCLIKNVSKLTGKRHMYCNKISCLLYRSYNQNIIRAAQKGVQNHDFDQSTKINDKNLNGRLFDRVEHR